MSKKCRPKGDATKYFYSIFIFQKEKHADIHNEIIKIGKKKEMNEAIDYHSQELEEKIGRETVTAVRAKNTRLWDWANKVAADAGNLV